MKKLLMIGVIIITLLLSSCVDQVTEQDNCLDSYPNQDKFCACVTTEYYEDAKVDCIVYWDDDK